MEEYPKTSPKTYGFIALAILIVAGLIWLFQSATPTTQPRTSETLAQSDLYVTNIESAPPEYQLAYLDEGALPRGNDVNAARIRYLLKTVSEKTGDDSSRVANRTAACTRLLKKDFGKAVTNQRFLEEANSYFNAGGPKLDYESLSAMLVASLGK